MSAWDWQTIQGVTGGSWVQAPPEGLKPPSGAALDSREITPGNIFFALKGEHVDGHGFLPQARANGAALLVVEREPDTESGPDERPPSAAVLRVGSVKGAMHRLASAYRDALVASGTGLVAVTGSNGKTTTVRMIHGALAPSLTGTHAQKSFNNDLGVPVTLLNGRMGDDYLICEVGTNEPGEIAPLGALIRPHMVVITSIGRAHLELLGSVEGVAREKLSLLDATEPDAVAFIPDAPDVVDTVLAQKAGLGITTRRVGRTQNADERVEIADQQEDWVGFRLGQATFRIPMSGAHNACNAANAVLIARRFGLPDEQIGEGLSRMTPPPMRLQRQRVAIGAGSLTCINDAYNANPESMGEAIRLLASAPHGGRRVAVLGEMREMGDAGPDVHREIGELLVQTNAADLVLLVGRLAMFVAERLSRDWDGTRYRVFPSADEPSASEIASLLLPDDLVLLKGSRSVGLERVLRAVQEKQGLAQGVRAG